MKFYKELEDNKAVCLLCSHYCKLKDGQTGICGVNKNVNGKVENLVYGKVAAINIDPIEKKPLYHFLPTSKSLSFGTVGCNFKCPFCQNWGISQEKNIEAKSKEYSPKELVQIAKNYECASISYTYNEPTIFYPFIRDTALLAKKEGIKNVFVTNGFESKEVVEDMASVIDAANVDLKSFQSEYYKKELGGRLDVVLKNIKRMKELGIWVEVTTLIVPTKNSSTDELKEIASFIASVDRFMPWHISAFHPDYKEQDLPPTSLDMLLNAYNIGKEVGLEFIYIGNIGFENDTLCPGCGEVLIQRRGFGAKIVGLEKNRCKKCKRVLEGVYE